MGVCIFGPPCILYATHASADIPPHKTNPRSWPRTHELWPRRVDTVSRVIRSSFSISGACRHLTACRELQLHHARHQSTAWVDVRSRKTGTNRDVRDAYVPVMAVWQDKDILYALKKQLSYRNAVSSEKNLLAYNHCGIERGGVGGSGAVDH